mgnify:FL=1
MFALEKDGINYPDVLVPSTYIIPTNSGRLMYALEKCPGSFLIGASSSVVEMTWP